MSKYAILLENPYTSQRYDVEYHGNIEEDMHVQWVNGLSGIVFHNAMRYDDTRNLGDGRPVMVETLVLNPSKWGSVSLVKLEEKENV